MPCACAEHRGPNGLKLEKETNPLVETTHIKEGKAPQHFKTRRARLAPRDRPRPRRGDVHLDQIKNGPLVFRHVFYDPLELPGIQQLRAEPSHSIRH